jgi:hypothetical protein
MFRVRLLLLCLALCVLGGGVGKSSVAAPEPPTGREAGKNDPRETKNVIDSSHLLTEKLEEARVSRPSGRTERCPGQ